MKKLFNQIKKYKLHLINEEKSAATIEKYVYDITAFYVWLKGRELTKEIVLTYKRELIKDYATASVNSAICSLNGFLAYIGRHDFIIETVEIKIYEISTTVIEEANMDMTMGGM